MELKEELMPEIMVGIGKRVEDDKVPNHWVQFEKDYIGVIVDKPSIIVFGGNSTFGMKEANGNAKVVQGFIGKVNEPIDIISVFYGDYSSDIAEENNMHLAEKLFVPLVQENGKRLPLEKAMKNMRKVNIFTHCAGNEIFQGVLDEFGKKLNDLGYAKEEQSQIFGQIFLLGYAPIEHLKNDEVKQFYVQSVTDDHIMGAVERLFELQQSGKIQLSLPEAMLSQGETLDEYKAKMEKLNDKQFILSALDDNKLFYFTSEQAPDSTSWDHTFIFVERDKNFEVYETSRNSTNMVSVCMAETLLRFLADSITNEHNKKVKPLESIEKTKEYCDSVLKNMKPSEERSYDQELLF